jgi:hypothetical protein
MSLKSFKENDASLGIARKIFQAQTLHQADIWPLKFLSRGQ